HMLSDKLHYLSRVASFVVFSGSLPRDVENDFYADAIHDLNRRGIKCVLDCEGEPLRLGVEAEPYLVSPNQQEAESLVGREFNDEEDFVMALDTIADLGAPTVLITQETACFAPVREGRRVPRLRASIPRLQPIPPVGTGALAPSCGAAFAEPTASPSFVPSVAENHEIRSWGPDAVRTASTLEERAIATGTPRTNAWPSCSPVTASTMRSVLLRLTVGRPDLTTVAGTYAMRPAAAASWSAGSAPGSSLTSVRVTRRIPPSEIF